MKRWLSFLLILSVCLSLSACANSHDVTYYYARDEADYQYGVSDGVIAGEHREAAGHVDDLRYLLILYFHGPVSDNLRSPFPSGTKLMELVQEDDSLTIQLSSIVSVLEDEDLTLACACLAQTCFTLTDVQSVTILSEGLETVSVTIERDSLLLVDDSAQAITQSAD